MFSCNICLKNEIVGTTISAAGTWQQRGISSKNVMVTTIVNSTGHILIIVSKEEVAKYVPIGKAKLLRVLTNLKHYVNVCLTILHLWRSTEADGVLECFNSK